MNTSPLRTTVLSNDNLDCSTDLPDSLLLTHFHFGCRCHRQIINTRKHDAMKKLPAFKNAEIFKWWCPICMVMKVQKISMNLTTVLLNTATVQMLFIDFAFSNVMSVRGFDSYLSVTDNATSFPFTSPTRFKRAPVDLIKFVIHELRQQGKKVQYIRFEKGGEITGSSRVNKMLLIEKVVDQSTWGCVSHLNKDERAHCNTNNMIICQFYTTGMRDKNYFYAQQHMNYI